MYNGAISITVLHRGGSVGGAVACSVALLSSQAHGAGGRNGQPTWPSTFLAGLAGSHSLTLGRLACSEKKKREVCPASRIWSGEAHTSRRQPFLPRRGASRSFFSSSSSSPGRPPPSSFLCAYCTKYPSTHLPARVTCSSFGLGSHAPSTYLASCPEGDSSWSTMSWTWEWVRGWASVGFVAGPPCCASPCRSLPRQRSCSVSQGIFGRRVLSDLSSNLPPCTRHFHLALIQVSRQPSSSSPTCFSP